MMYYLLQEIFLELQCSKEVCIMQINKISNQQQSFGKLLSGSSLKRTLGPDRQDLINKYNYIKSYIWQESLHKMNYVDIILDYSMGDGFYGVIRNKERKIPTMLKNYYCKVNTSDNALKIFKDWVSQWNQRFAK